MLKSKISVIIFLIFIHATVVFSTAFANEPSLELSEEVDKAAEAEAKPKSLVEKILKTKKDLKDKYGTTISFLTNVQIQSALHAKTNEGKSRASWYYNVALEQKLWMGALADF